MGDEYLILDKYLLQLKCKTSCVKIQQTVVYHLTQLVVTADKMCLDGWLVTDLSSNI